MPQCTHSAVHAVLSRALARHRPPQCCARHPFHHSGRRLCRLQGDAAARRRRRHAHARRQPRCCARRACRPPLPPILVRTIPGLTLPADRIATPGAFNRAWLTVQLLSSLEFTGKVQTSDRGTCRCQHALLAGGLAEMMKEADVRAALLRADRALPQVCICSALPFQL